ncbi:uncharacterized protein LY89DRAFT_688014 [Mollisia scopiformis]|uniref:Uncharacterized protein n=1 Tax=Mollisia scopiformis TaxID=149040 RepID=A0A194WWB4_MOLSC|nr:uncharacterized protein LY89DRAFT_688014 [Mollisia scopiformis]KUJ12261.1 hypothetical protein LY89DRAFT_688014 [Mollisia scopiformis]
MQFTISLLAIASVSGLVSAAPKLAARQTTSVIYACTNSTFPVGDPCPNGISMGSGFCAALNVEPFLRQLGLVP